MDIKFSLPITFSYHAIFKKKLLLFFFLLALLGTLVLYAIAVGSYDLPPESVLRALLGQAGGPIHTVVWNTRMPRIVAAIVSGWGLALSGIAFQSLLKILYPALFADLDPKKKADEIYSFLLGKAVYGCMEKEFGEIAGAPRF